MCGLGWTDGGGSIVRWGKLHVGEDGRETTHLKLENILHGLKLLLVSVESIESAIGTSDDTFAGQLAGDEARPAGPQRKKLGVGCRGSLHCNAAHIIHTLPSRVHCGTAQSIDRHGRLGMSWAGSRRDPHLAENSSKVSSAWGSLRRATVVLKLRLEAAITPGTKAPARLEAATGRYARKKLVEGPRAMVRRREVDAMASWDLWFSEGERD
jgi:hypothetical protein